MLYFDYNQPFYDKFEEMLLKFFEVIYIATVGTGKTDIAVEFVRKHNLNTLVICPTVSLCEAWNKMHEIAGVAAIQSITYNSFVSMYKVLSTGFDCYIFDEAHHMDSPSWGPKIKEFKEMVPDKYVIGLTAISVRFFDGGKDVAETMFNGHIVRGYDTYQAIAAGILPKPTYISAIYDNNTKDKITNNGELQGKLDFILNSVRITDILRENAPKSIKAIAFADNIRSIPDIVNILKKAFPNERVTFIHSKLMPNQVYNTIEEFRNSNNGIIVNVGILTEGHHIDGVNTVIMFRKTTSIMLYTQQIGRCLAAKSKESPTVFDFVSNDESVRSIIQNIQYGRTLIYALLGLDPEKSDQIIIRSYSKDYEDILIKVHDLDKKEAWTEEEDNILKEFYPTMFTNVCTKLPGRSKESCRKRAKRLGIVQATKVGWTAEEDQILRINYPTMGGNVYKLLEGRTKLACVRRANKLKIPTKFIYKWKDKDIKYLKERYPIDGPDIHSAFDGLSRTECIMKAIELGLDNNDSINVPWSSEEDKLLKDNYPIMGTNVFKIIPNRSRIACKARAQKFGLTFLN